MSPVEHYVSRAGALRRRPAKTIGSVVAAGRIAYLDPYDSQSIWKKALTAGITEAGATDPATVSWRSANATINTAAAWNIAVWYPKATDPTYPVTAASNANTVYMQVRTPANWKVPDPQAPAERDGWVSVIELDGASSVEFYKMTPVKDAAGNLVRFTVSRPPARTDLTGLGLTMNVNGITTTNSTWGMRASTIGYMPGALREWEVLALSIRHTLMFSSPNSVLWPGGWVWPSRSADTGYATAYTGNLPMGTRLALPRSTNINTLGLASAEGLELARALQGWGGIVGDRSSGNVLNAERPTEGTSTYTAYKAALDRMLPDWRNILAPRLVRVEGHTATLPGGPGAIIIPDAPPVEVAPLPQAA